MRYTRSALEAQLEVTRLARQQKEAERGDLYDNLHDEIKQQAEAEKKKQQQQAEENPVEETTDDTAEDEAMDTEADDDTTGAPNDGTASDAEEDSATESKESDDAGDAAKDDTDDDAESQDSDNDTVDEAKDDDPPPHSAKEDKTDKDAEVSETDDTSEKEQKTLATESHRLSFALEFFSSGMHETIEQFIALEDQYVPKLLQDNEFNEHKLAGNNEGFWIEEHLPYVAKMGFKYGSLLLKHVYKGVLSILDNVIKSMYQGSQMLIRMTNNAVKVYQNLQESIQDLNKALDALSELDDIAQRQPKGDYTKASIIAKLKVGKDTDVVSHVNTAIKLAEAYNSGLSKVVKDHLHTTQRLIDLVVEQQLKARPEALMREQMQLPGFKIEVVDGYEPENENCESYVFEDVLPGDVRFIAMLPSKTLSKREDIIAAYQAARFFFGVAKQDIEGIETMPYLDRDAIAALLDALNQLCDIGLKLRQQSPIIVTARSNLKSSLLRYLKYLLLAHHRISIEDSCAEYIALRARSLDKTYLSGALHVQDYLHSLISAGIQYAEANIRAIKDSSPD
jgi:hypothetical protein